MLVEGTNMLPEHNCKGVTKERGMVCEGGGGGEGIKHNRGENDWFIGGSG